MRYPTLILTLCLPAAFSQATFQRSAKRGLVFVPNPSYSSDNQIWISSGSDLTWYYNYGAEPSPVYSSAEAQSAFEFVPMLWGLSNDSFVDQVTTLIQGGTNITHVLTFNEPDGSSANGGSDIPPETAATAWIKEVEPLRKLGVKTGAPAVTGSPGGFTWLQEFFANCTNQGTNCTADFMTVHWYGDFQGLASQLGQVSAAYPNKTIWVSEYAYNNQSLSTSQDFFNTSTEYMDRMSNIERYAYFGSFRSSDSNVGPNAAMLTQDGKLTDIGSWYLGGAATNNVPNAAGRSWGRWDVGRGAWVTMAVVWVGMWLM
ncbi:glycoside hydrolase family 128 protein [Oidiodendron maius Zn]|uniref:Glycoside hydrolase family 128 protein n=1 Tax=Oidiodendron maius (strain Zn) TaxID=913774 RepID=A0A0C3GWU1_OIDMZ|nr:glycoside hydrolase family 128 protein [Oidiodendron maius Zn]